MGGWVTVPGTEMAVRGFMGQVVPPGSTVNPTLPYNAAPMAG